MVRSRLLDRFVRMAIGINYRVTPGRSRQLSIITDYRCKSVGNWVK